VAAVSAWAAQDKAATPDVHFTPTRHAVVDAMLQLAGVTSEDVVYDLGSGDGRIPIIAAQKYAARGVGIEIDARLVEQSRQTAREAGVGDRVAFIHGDLFTADLSQATVVTLYLSPSINRRLEAKLAAELKSGARVVSHQFPVPGWTPTTRARPDYSDIYLYRVPER
jgi:16S rRNA A1518/A1519 N6-dimethyltransferase RsmA/KsgA/DIM1 with predicted DNA glycosylase/AP lyase activity